MRRRPPRSTRTDTRFPYTTLFRSTYADDRGRARMSGPALGRAILKATDYIRNTPRSERCDGRIHLLCHSMGNWALRGAVQAMRTFVGNNIPPLFDEVILAAADEDDDTLQMGHKVGPLLRGCRRVTVYRSEAHPSELRSLMRNS